MPQPLPVSTHTLFSLSPELEKGLKKRVKLHTHENGENGQSRENGQNGEIDSDENHAEVRPARVGAHEQ